MIEVCQLNRALNDIFIGLAFSLERPPAGEPHKRTSTAEARVAVDSETGELLSRPVD
jgi:hypothetical protein